MLLGYLVAAGVVSPQELRAGSARVTDLSRTHAVSGVELSDGRRLVVKRARPRPGEFAGNIEFELAVYTLAQECPELAAAVPACLVLDPRTQVLVLRAVEPGRTLHDSVHSGSGLAPARARRLAELVADWQRATSRPPPAALPEREPWVLGILEPGGWRPPAADVLLVHGVVRRELRARFAELQALLVPSCLVHGDLKWDNCLLDGDEGVRVVDWETAAVGDPAWDVAGIVHEHPVLRRSVALINGRPPSGDADASLHVFLDSYREARPADADAVVARALRLTGARLVQTALEWAAAGMAEQAPRALLDDALQLLRTPERLLEPATS